MNYTRVKQFTSQGLLIAMAVFAVVWVVHRAAVQSITLDEANTYRYWVATQTPSHWDPHSNNHVLNSALMRLSIWLFGLSTFTVRYRRCSADLFTSSRCSG